MPYVGLDVYVAVSVDYRESDGCCPDARLTACWAWLPSLSFFVFFAFRVPSICSCKANQRRRAAILVKVRCFVFSRSSLSFIFSLSLYFHYTIFIGVVKGWTLIYFGFFRWLAGCLVLSFICLVKIRQQGGKPYHLYPTPSYRCCPNAAISIAMGFHRTHMGYWGFNWATVL